MPTFPVKLPWGARFGIMSCMKDVKQLLLPVAFAVATVAQAEVVAFRDAATIKSWDAWNDHKQSVQAKECRSVTWERLNGLEPGFKEIGRLAVRDAKDIKSSKWSVGCESVTNPSAVDIWAAPGGKDCVRIPAGCRSDRRRPRRSPPAPPAG